MNSVTLRKNFNFVRIKVKRQEYFGKPAIVVLLCDVTKKILLNLKEKGYQEKQEAARQKESFTSTVSHELRTPLGNVLFFLNFVLNFLVALEISLDVQPKLETSKKYINLSI